MWGSLSHEFVLPLSGIYQDDELKLFISPYMENGTLAQWRKKVNPSTAEVEQHVWFSVLLPFVYAYPT